MTSIRERLDRFLRRLAAANEEAFGSDGPDCCSPEVKTDGRVSGTPSLTKRSHDEGTGRAPQR